MIFDVRGGGLGFGIIPGGVFVLLTVGGYVIVVRGSFPGADSGVSARFEMFAVEAFGGEVVVSFHLLGVIAFGEDHISPGCFCHAFQMRVRLFGHQFRI